MKKQKVLIVHNYYQIPGGEDTVVENESNMLTENGHDVVFYTRHNHEINSSSVLGKIKLFFESIFSIKTYRDVKKIIEEEKIDIVHVHNTLPLISPSVYYAAFSKKTPVVQTIHNFRLMCPGATLTRNSNICEECIQSGLSKALKHKCYRNSFFQTLSVIMLLKVHRILKTYQKVNGYIALTEFNKIKLSNLINDTQKIYVKPNFVKRVSDKKYEKRNVENYFVFIGRLDKLKGIDVLVDSWKSISDSELYIIGDGPEKVSLQNYIKENNISNIKLLGFMNRKRVAEVAKKSIAVITPSQWFEPFGLVVIEAFSLGVPVIGSDIGAISDIINTSNGIKFKHSSKEELIKAIIKLKENKELVNKLGIGAWNTVNLKYSDSINYIKLMNIYEQIIGDEK